MAKNSIFLQTVIAACLLPLLLQATGTAKKHCRCSHTEACWPSDSTWQAFNASVSGRLVATVPIAAPCHESSFGAYNEIVCKNLQDTWTEAGTQYAFFDLHLRSILRIRKLILQLRLLLFSHGTLLREQEL